MKTLKFSPDLVSLILSGEKVSTWRLFDDKDLKEGDKLSLINKEDGREFAQAIITDVREKKMNEITQDDFLGHEKFENEEKMYEAYKTYYGDKVTSESVIKMIRFRIEKWL